MGGRGSSSATRTRVTASPVRARTVAPTPATQAQQMTATPVTPQQAAQDMQQAAQAAVAPYTINAQPLSQADVKRLVAAQNAHMAADPDADIARSIYISKATDASGFSMSQNLNYKLEHGGTLDGRESYVYQYLGRAMQPLGVDAQLNRGAHADVVQALGVGDWSRMSASQLSQALTGQTWTSKSFTSTSYDQRKNPFFSGSQAGGREVVLRMHVSKQTQVVMGARDQTEVILGIGTHFQVTGAGFTGVTATPRRGRPTRQIYLDVDVW